MEAVCRLIPDNLDDVDLERTSYHRGCYQAFTKHPNRWKCVLPDDEPQLFDLLVNHQPLPRTFFLQNLETKVSGRTERCVQFASFKGKEAAWTHIESQALEIGDNRLHRKVTGEDLFAREAQGNWAEGGRATSSLRHLYVQELERCGFPNPDFRSDKLKTRLERHTINECIAITKVFSGDGGCIAYNLVYSTSISVAEAVTCAYRIGSKDKFEDVAWHLRSVVQGMFDESTPLPPTADELDARASEEYLPTDLVKFLSTLILGEAEVEKLSHWESYYFDLEVETALAEAIDDVSSSLTPQITTGEDNEVFHVEWDNLNKITTTVHGSNVVNSTGGIMIQEVKPNTDIADKDRTFPLKQRNKTRCLGDGTPLTMSHFHIYGRAGPKFPTGAKFSPPIKNDKLYSECIREYRLWCLMRMATSSKETQLVPGFGGFISATGKKPSRKSTIDYFNPINQPFTEYSVIRELLKRSEDATLEVGQKKAYAKDLFSLKTVSEVMERLLIECFSEEEDINVTNPVALLNAAQNCNRESLDHALHDPSTAHISRVNHRLAIYKRADIPIFWSPKPYDPEQGWEEMMRPVWSCGPVLPPTMIDLVEKTTEEMEQCDDDIEEEQSEQDSDYEELLGDNED
ncbi:hypothetical protein GQR58_015101 [Nymphon striatum]|nr:hypothetical protein GQR58_015101 [Nymphon striatum]